MWLPYTSLFLAARSRPFYGPADKAPTPVKPPSVPRKVSAAYRSYSVLLHKIILIVVKM